jgi:[3-methyl-2-oxobutanoate dehydrogenase (acetyl-transferring)] kinase
MAAKRLLTGIVPLSCINNVQRFSTHNGNKTAESRQRALQLSQYFNDSAIDQAAEQPLVKLNAITMMYSSRSDDQTHILRSSSFLRRELPIRLAHLVKILRNLPFIVACNPSILDVIERYIQAFKNFENVQLEIKDLNSEEKFTEQVRSTLKLNKDILALLADGFRETRRYIKNEDFVKNYLNQILTARMATRILCEHHLALHQQAKGLAAQQSTLNTSSLSSSSDEQDSTSTTEKQADFVNSSNWVGVINKEFSPRKLVEKSSKMVSNLCLNKYGLCPKIKIDGHVNAKFPYIPMPIEYILPELLKNAYRATVEHNRHLTTNAPMPDVSVTIAVNEKDCVIRIRDRGGGWFKLCSLFSIIQTTGLILTSPKIFRTK